MHMHCPITNCCSTSQGNKPQKELFLKKRLNTIPIVYNTYVNHYLLSPSSALANLKGMILYQHTDIPANNPIHHLTHIQPYQHTILLTYQHTIEYVWVPFADLLTTGSRGSNTLSTTPRHYANKTYAMLAEYLEWTPQTRLAVHAFES